MMRCRHHHFDNVIFIDRLHALDSLTATMLALKVIYIHTLDIAKFCKCDNSICNRNHIFHGNIIFIKSDRGSTIIPILIRDSKDFFLDNTKQLLFICKNCL